MTRGGTPVRTARFMAGRVVALVEHPAADEAPREGDAPLRGLSAVEHGRVARGVDERGGARHPALPPAVG